LARRLLLVLASTATALLLVEGALQLAALTVGRGPAARRAAGRLQVLCIGDSNTYGLLVAPGESYPARLQQIWDAGKLQPSIQAVNIGYPGTNSSQVLRDIDRNLDLFEPDVVVIEIGANDFWTLPVPVDEHASESFLSSVKRWSRLYRLIYMAMRDPNAPVVTNGAGGESKGKLEFLGDSFDLGSEPAAAGDSSIRDSLPQLVDHLTRVVERVRARGAAPVLLNYASSSSVYRLANTRIEKVATSTDTPLVDLQPVFRAEAVCPTEPCPRWVFPNGHAAHGHPTPEGYELVAKAVAEKLQQIVGETPDRKNQAD
jgi:lysophospholipase L1-like esterase